MNDEHSNPTNLPFFSSGVLIEPYRGPAIPPPLPSERNHAGNYGKQAEPLIRRRIRYDAPDPVDTACSVLIPALSAAAIVGVAYCAPLIFLVALLPCTILPAIAFIALLVISLVNSIKILLSSRRATHPRATLLIGMMGLFAIAGVGILAFMLANHLIWESQQYCAFMC